MLEGNNIPYKILTYAANTEWQKLKLQACDLLAKAEVMDNKGKGKKIALSKSSNATYHIEGETQEAKSVCIIDDKAGEFEELPPGCIGYWLQRDGKLLKSQKGKVPWNEVELAA